MLLRQSPPRKSSDQQLGKRPPGGRRNVAKNGGTAGKKARATFWENGHTKGGPVNSNSYLPDFETDVFISYTHTDNAPFGEDQERWIARLHSRLEIRVEQFLGRKVSIFRDEKLQGNDAFAEVLLEKLERVATLVCVVFSALLPFRMVHPRADRVLSSRRAIGGTPSRKEDARVQGGENAALPRSVSRGVAARAGLQLLSRTQTGKNTRVPP